jgi:hypothetical protein
MAPEEIRRAYERLVAAWLSHDLVTVQSLHRADAVLEIEGSSRFAGAYAGVGALLAGLAKIQPYVVPSDPNDTRLVEGETTIEVIAEVGVRAPLSDETRRTVIHTLLEYDEGASIARVRQWAEDQPAFDAFIDADQADG